MVKAIRPVIGVAHGVVIPSVRVIENQAEVQSRPGEIGMPWAVHIVPVVYVDVSCVVIKDTIRPVVDIESAYTVYTSVAIAYAYIADLVDTAVEIIIDGNIFHLDHGTVIIILYKGIVVESGIEGYTNTAEIDMPTRLVESIDKEIKFPVRIDRKGDPTFREDE